MEVSIWSLERLWNLERLTRSKMRPAQTPAPKFVPKELPMHPVRSHVSAPDPLPYGLAPGNCTLGTSRDVSEAAK
jgi:hypothetical protein